MVADCEKYIAASATCGVIAVGRCRACGDAFCVTHRAMGGAWPNAYPVIDWCAPCQAQAEADARASEAIKQAEAQAFESRAAALNAAACQRLPELLAEFRSRDFRGEARTWTTREYRGRTFWGFGSEPKYKYRHHQDEPAVPIGLLGWTWLTGNRDNPEGAGLKESGLTRAGAFVVMHPPQDFNGNRSEASYRLMDGQESEIERLIKRLLARY